MSVSFTWERSHLYPETGLPRSGKSQGKTKIFQGQGKVREFCKKSGKISVLVKVSEKSGNFVFRLAQGFVKIMKTFSFGDFKVLTGLARLLLFPRVSLYLT